MISVVIPTYNREQKIQPTIESLLRQSYKDFELLIVDDGSTDNTEEVINAFQAKDHRIKYIKKPNGGQASARNIGLEKSVGDIVVYVDSDDPVFDYFLEEINSQLKEKPKKSFGVSNHNRFLVLVDERGDEIKRKAEKLEKQKNSTAKDYVHWKLKACGTGIFHRKKIKESNIKWDESLDRFEDFDFVLTMIEKFPNEFLYIQKPLFDYLQEFGGDGICSRTTYLEWADGFKKMYEKHKKNPLMNGQEWHPSRYQKYLKLHEDFQEGKVPPPQLRYFQN